MKYKLLGLALCTSLSGQLLAADGVVHFQGQIASNACEVDQNSKSLDVDLGTIAIASFSQKGSTSDPTAFSLNLINCPAALAGQNVTVTFSGNQDSDDNTLLAVDGDAKGAGIEIDDANNTLIPIGQPSSNYVMQTGANTLNFRAHYKSTVEQTSMAAGDASGTAQFGINYP